MATSNILTIMEAFGASGIATIITAVITYRLSAKKQATAEPNGQRTRLNDEVVWLRHQLEILQNK